MNPILSGIVTKVRDTTRRVVDPYLYSSKLKLVLQMKSDLERHEGYRYYAYPDVLSPLFKAHPREQWGFKPAREILSKLGIRAEDAAKSGAPWTVGHGFAVGITLDMTMDRQLSERKLEQHILEGEQQLYAALPWAKDASFVTKTVLLNMMFNMGLRSLLGFKNTLRYIKDKNYEKAASNMTQSLWYRQVGSRAKELVERMRTQTILPAHRAKEKL